MQVYSYPGITAANFANNGFYHKVQSKSCLLNIGFLCTTYAAGNSLIEFSFDLITWLQYGLGVANLEPTAANGNAGQFIGSAFAADSGLAGIRLIPNAGTTATLTICEYLYPMQMVMNGSG